MSWKGRAFKKHAKLPLLRTVMDFKITIVKNLTPLSLLFLFIPFISFDRHGQFEKETGPDELSISKFFTDLVL